MVILIAKKDFLEYLRDGRLYWAGGITALLLLAALAVGIQRQAEVNAARVVAQELSYQDWLQQDDKNPHDSAHQGLHVLKSEPSLSLIDPGIGPYVGAAIWLQSHVQGEVRFRPAQDATGLQRFGELSAAWILQILGPLFVIVLGFDALAGEREKGTLRQTLSMGVGRLPLMSGKILALGGCLGLLALPALVVATIAVVANAEGAALADSLLRLLLLVSGYAVYLGIYISLVLAVSALVPSSRLALVILLGIWIVTTMMMPRAASDLSRLWHEAPTRFDFVEELTSELGIAQQRAWR